MILQVNFKLAVSAEEYRKLSASVAQAFAEVAGLRWKVWILNEGQNEAGGIYLFDSAESLRTYLDGPLAAQIASLPAIQDLSVKQFSVMDEETGITRGPVQ